MGGRRDESGGAATLWVVLMVPIAAFAASVALAGPQRMAAESSLREATDDLAKLAVVWRDGQGTYGELTGFPLDCTISRADEAEVTALQNSGDLAGANAKQAEINGYLQECQAFLETIARDLGGLGIDVESIRGYYSDSLDLSVSVPCSWSPTLEVRNAVHVALAADWEDAGWAAAQVWPDGLPMGSESIGRLERRVTPGAAGTSSQCHAESLDPVDERGRARWLSGDMTPREFTASAPSRTTFGRDARGQ